VFGRRRREEAAAAEAVREAERHALFAKLAERPEHICPFLGLADDRAGYVEGVSDDHRCYAFGDPAPLSAEQQTRVCEERGYGNCPRYLRGVLVIPTEELEALRRPRPATEVVPDGPPAPPRRRRRVAPLVGVVAVLLLLAGGAAAYLALFQEPSVAVDPTATPTPSAEATLEPTADPTESPTPTAEPTPTPAGSGPATPTPEPTPTAGDTFAFYEVSVGPTGYTLYGLAADGSVENTREASFASFSYARADPREGTDGEVYWETAEGGLAGWSYRYPDSGEFRVRAVFRSSDGERRSVYLEEEELTELPEATPAP
jgi:hypothetical protein